MECEKEKCKLAVMYPNTNASVACDLECYFKKNKL